MLYKPLQTGPLKFDFPIIQAALSGYSDAPMRRIAREFGASFALCEVFLDQFVMNVSKKSKSRLCMAVQDSDHPCGAQLMGSDPEEFVAAARRLIDFGFDLIDLNFACPVKKVLGRCRGGYLMSDPFQALAITEKVRAALPDSIPLTVKLRKGFDDSPESREAFFDLLSGLLDRGIAGITLHGRTVLQRYTGSADWDFIRSVKNYLIEEKKRPDIPLIGSGDLFSAEICLKRYRETGIDGLALARGIIGNPWLFREIRALFDENDLPDPPSLAEQKEVILDHYRRIEDLYGEKRASAMMRKFGVQYAKRHPRSDQVRRAFVFCKNTAMWIDALNHFYG